MSRDDPRPPPPPPPLDAANAAAAAALAASERRYRSFVEASAQIVWRVNARGEVDAPIPTWCAFTGQSDAETRGLGWLGAVAPADRAAVRDAWARAIAAGETYEVEYGLRRADGEWRRVVARGVPVRGDDGRVAEWIGTCRDATEQRAAEAARAEAEARLALAADAAGLGAWERDLATGESRWDARLAAMVGLPPGRAAEAAARWAEWIHPDDRARVAAAPDGEEVEYRVLPADLAARGERVFRGRAVRSPDGRRVIGAVRDVTDERRAADALREREELLRHAAEAGGVGAWAWDLGRDRIAADARFCEAYGVDPARMAAALAAGEGGLPVAEFVANIHPGDLPRVSDAIARAVGAAAEGGGAGAETAAASFREEYRVRGADGAERWVLAQGRALPADPARGLPARFPGMVIDVTERRAAEAALAESEARLRAVLDAAPVGVVAAEAPSGRLLYGNAAVERVFRHPMRYSGGVGEYREWVSYDADGRPVRAEDYPLARTLATGEPAAGEFHYLCGDGVRRWVAISSAPVRGPGGALVGAMVVCADVDEARRAEAVLRRRNAGLEARVVEAEAARARLWALAEDLFVAGDLDGPRLLEVSDSWERVLGWPRERLLAGPVADLIHPDDRALVAARLDELRRTGRAPRYENRVRTAAGGWRTVAWTLAAEPGGGTRFVGVGRDVTEERARAAALAEAEAALAHARRMEALGQLAGGVAHDFNNVLQAVQGGAALIAQRPGDAAAVARLARMVGEAAGRGASVTRRLLALSRRAELRAEAVDAAALLGELAEVLRHTLGAGLEVRVEAEPGLPPLWADRGQLETVLVNLATNARDALGGRGAVRLRAAARRGEDGAGGRHVALAVADDGPGMPPEVLARAGEPFFTTKPKGEGTGLGLSMARGFAEQSGGGLAIDSAPGRGTAVTLWLPAVAAAAERPGPTAPGDGREVAVAAAAPAAVAPPRRRPRVLLVDDEDVVRAVTAEGLRAAGFDVAEAPSAEAALALLDRGAGAAAVDLLVTDLSMPGADGLALAREAQRRLPGLPAILLTGFVTDMAEIAVGGALSGAFTLLRKPVAPDVLAERAAAALEGRAAAAAAAAAWDPAG